MDTSRERKFFPDVVAQYWEDGSHFMFALVVFLWKMEVRYSNGLAAWPEIYTAIAYTTNLLNAALEGNYERIGKHLLMKLVA